MKTSDNMNDFTIYASNIRSEWWGRMKSSSMAWPSKAGTKQEFATYIVKSNSGTLLSIRLNINK